MQNKISVCYLSSTLYRKQSNGKDREGLTSQLLVVSGHNHRQFPGVSGLQEGKLFPLAFFGKETFLLFVASETDHFGGTEMCCK